MRIKASTKYFPRLTEWHVRRCLKWASPLDLAGVEIIHLVDEQTSEKHLRKRPAFYLDRSGCLGEYKKRARRTGSIYLYTRHLYFGVPALFMITPVATLRVAFTLIHEIGHHIIARQGFIYEPTEKFKLKEFNDPYQEALVDRFANDVLRRMLCKWQYRFGRWLSKKISGFYYQWGVVDWEQKDYDRAAYYWFFACQADQENEDAVRGWQQAVAKVDLASSPDVPPAGARSPSLTRRRQKRSR